MQVSSSAENKYVSSKQTKKSPEKKQVSQSKSDTKETQKKSDLSKTMTQSTNHDSVELSNKIKKTSKEKEKSGIFETAYELVLGQPEESPDIVNQKKLKEFKEKLKKDDPERYKQYEKSQSTSDKKIKETQNQALQSALGIEQAPGSTPDEKKVKEFEEKLKKEYPERYKKYKKLQDSTDKELNKNMSQAKETLEEGVKKSDYYFNGDKILKYGITGVDEYEVNKDIKHADTQQMKLAKNKSSKKDHVASLVNSQGAVNKSNLESAEGMQVMASTIDDIVSFGAAGKIVDAKKAYDRGDYGEMAWDAGSALVRIAGAAALQSGEAFKWAGKGISKISTVGDEMLKTLAPDAYQSAKSGAGAAKELVKDALTPLGKGADQVLKSITGSDAEGIWNWANKPVEEAIGDAGKAVKGVVEDAGKAVKGVVDDAGKAVKGVVDDAGKAVKGVVDDAGKAVKETGEKISNMTEDLLKGGKDEFKNLPKDVNGKIDTQKLREAYKNGKLTQEQLAKLSKEGKISSNDYLDIKYGEKTDIPYGNKQMKQPSFRKDVTKPKIYGDEPPPTWTKKGKTPIKQPSPEIYGDEPKPPVKTEQGKIPGKNKVDASKPSGSQEKGKIPEDSGTYTESQDVPPQDRELDLIHKKAGSGGENIDLRNKYKNMNLREAMKKYEEILKNKGSDEASKFWIEFSKSRDWQMHGSGENIDTKD